MNRFVQYIVFFLISTASLAAELPPRQLTQIDQPSISIIIDDVGERLIAGERAIFLPGQVTYSFLPFTQHSKTLAKLAFKRNKEIMLHMPMQPISDKNMGPGGLTGSMSRLDFLRAVHLGLSSIPHVSGLNNHMGSLLTQKPQQMRWLMQALNLYQGLYFVDSRTINNSVAWVQASNQSVPNIKRDIFLDHVQDKQFIRVQFLRLIRIARKYGSAVAIGHPHAETLSFLERVLPNLDQYGVQLVPVSSLINKKYNNQPPFRATIASQTLETITK